MSFLFKDHYCVLIIQGLTIVSLLFKDHYCVLIIQGPLLCPYYSRTHYCVLIIQGPLLCPYYSRNPLLCHYLGTHYCVLIIQGLFRDPLHTLQSSPALKYLARVSLVLQKRQARLVTKKSRHERKKSEVEAINRYANLTGHKP